MNQAAFFVFQALKSKVCVFQTKDNGLCRQKVSLNPSLLIYSGNCESSKVRTNSVRNFQLVLSWWVLYQEATSRKVTSPLGTLICTRYRPRHQRTADTQLVCYTIFLHTVCAGGFLSLHEMNKPSWKKIYDNSCMKLLVFLNRRQLFSQVL